MGGRLKISRAVPNIRSNRPAETRDFFVDVIGFEVAMDLGWVVTVASPTNPSAQVTIVGNDDMAAPDISVEVADVDAEAVEDAVLGEPQARATAGGSLDMMTPPKDSSGRLGRVKVARDFYPAFTQAPKKRRNPLSCGGFFEYRYGDSKLEPASREIPAVKPNPDDYQAIRANDDPA